MLNQQKTILPEAWQYHAAGNQVRAQNNAGVWQRFQYDAANRLVKVKADNNVTVLASYTYGDSNVRLITDEGGYRTYYAANGGTVIAEYSETPSLPTTPKWSKSYVYLGGRLLSTLTPNGSGGEAVNYHHPDRLGTRVVTDPVAGTSFEQVTLPFGTALDAESTDATNRRFTSYDRSGTTGLDYAVNRHYDPQQGRFSQVDPIGMSAASIGDPQSFNHYAYTRNDPVNLTDPTGLMCIQFHFTNTTTGEGFWTEWYCTPGTSNFEPKGGIHEQGHRPQNSHQVPVPIKDVNKLKELMQDRLDYGDCKDTVNSLIAQLSRNALHSNNPGNQPTFGSVMDVFDSISKDGGIRINVPPSEYPPGERQAGGSGYSFREYERLSQIDVRWHMKTWIYLKGAYSDSRPLAFERLPYDYGITGIHETLHQISRNMYSEADLNQAARDLGGKGIDDYLKAHCIPLEYR